MKIMHLRERKKAKTKAQLIATAYDLFQSKGFENTTVHEIVEEVELSQRTFFRYFPTKESIVFWDHERRTQGLLDALQKDGDTATPFDRLQMAVDEIMAFYQTNRTQLLAEYRIVTGSAQLIALDIEQDLQFENIIAQSLQEGGRHAMDSGKARMLAGAIFGAIRACMEQWFEGGCKDDLNLMARQINTMIALLAKGYGPEGTDET